MNFAISITALSQSSILCVVRHSMAIANQITALYRRHFTAAITALFQAFDLDVARVSAV